IRDALTRISGLCGFIFPHDLTTDIYTLSLHDALPICLGLQVRPQPAPPERRRPVADHGGDTAIQPIVPIRARRCRWRSRGGAGRSEEHTSELQSLAYLVCRLLLEKKKTTRIPTTTTSP